MIYTLTPVTEKCMGEGFLGAMSRLICSGAQKQDCGLKEQIKYTGTHCRNLLNSRETELFLGLDRLATARV